MDLLEPFGYAFMRRALAAGVLIAVCAALIGVPLVLKRLAMIGDGLSHVGFASLALAAALHGAPLAVSLPVVILSAFVLLNLREKQLRSDAALALISTASLALGIIVLSLSDGMNTDVSSLLFGSILALDGFELNLSVILCLSVIILYAALYERIFALTFDEGFARAAGVSVRGVNFVVALMMAIVIVLGMRMMGALLISNLIVLPAITAMKVFRSFRGAVLYAACIAALSFAAGLTASCLLSTPAGASVVMCSLALFALHLPWAALKG